MSRILVLQFRIAPYALEQERVCLERELGDYAQLEYVSVFDETITWDAPQNIMSAYDGLVLGGSGDLDFDGNRPADDPVRHTSLALVEQLRPLLDYVFAADIPTLGICYGHQLLGTYAGARVHCDTAQSKTKSHELALTVDPATCPILADVPAAFFGQYGHKDVLDRVPEGARLIVCGGEACRVSALQYRNNIYTVQFHPELTYADMVERVKSTNTYLPDGVTVEEVFTDDPHSRLFLRNFGVILKRENHR